MSMPELSVIPKPTRTTVREGRVFLTYSAIVVAEEKFFAEDFRRFAGNMLCEGEQTEIVYSLRADKELGDEGYRLVVDNRVDITATSYAGLVYGWQTLKQLVSQFDIDGIAGLPRCEIVDRPRFPYRGYMFDICRHWFDKAEIKRQMDLAVLYKLNVFHLHLSEDQGFRLESERYPRLNEISSHRAETRGDKTPHGGYLTKADVAEIVAYAAERAMEVVPEIDIPGHTSAMIAAYPELSCEGEKIEVETTFGVKKTILCAGNDNTLEFVKNLLTEVAEQFPSNLFHIGGDEAPKDKWSVCPKCLARVEKEGLRDMEDLQGYFTNVVVKHLKSLGKTAIVWNESINSGILDKDVVCQFWQDKKGGAEVKKQANEGRKTIMSPFFSYYLDYPYGMTSLKKAYEFEPNLKGLDENGRNSVIGVETPLWTEFVATEKRADYMVFPRLCAVAETGWTDASAKNYADFEKRLVLNFGLLDSLAVGYAPLADVNPGLLQRMKQMSAFLRVARGKDPIE